MPGKIRAVVIHAPSPDREMADATLTKIKEWMPGCNIYGNFEGTIQVAGSTPFEMAKAAYSELARTTPVSPDDSLALFTGLCPFLDKGIADDLAKVHTQFYAHYSYCENSPYGFLPDLVSSEFLAEAEPGATDLRDFVFKNIEKYDAEILYRRPDVRQFRLDFSCASPRSLDLARRLRAIDPDVTYERIEKVIHDHPEILRPFPSYFEIDLTSLSKVHPIIYPEISGADSLPLALAMKLNAEIAAHGWKKDATVSLAGRGEPMLHPDFLEILKLFLANESVSTVFVETYGHSIDEKQITLWNSLPGAEKLSVILRLSTLKKDRYRFLYGEDLFEPAMAAAVHLEKATNRKFAAYVEMLKIKEVEDEITPFFDRFENSTVRVILNKYNRYIDLLPERRVTDLTPLDRSFCWHIARDFYLKPDGTVPLCKQDISGRVTNHDFAKKTILEILSATATAHSHSVRGEHDSIGMPCLNCDEWYTFNG